MHVAGFRKGFTGPPKPSPRAPGLQLPGPCLDVDLAHPGMFLDYDLHLSAFGRLLPDEFEFLKEFRFPPHRLVREIPVHKSHESRMQLVEVNVGAAHTATTLASRSSLVGFAADAFRRLRKTSSGRPYVSW